MNKNFFLIEHPIVKRDVTILRDKNTDSENFRAALQRVSNILAVELSKEFKLTKTEVETPLRNNSRCKTNSRCNTCSGFKSRTGNGKRFSSNYS